jgi:putative colanic acid biosynthesis acetyltransferase WcaF
MDELDLSTFDNSGYRPGRSLLVQTLWFLIGLPLLKNHFIPSSGFRAKLLRIFGAKLGIGVVLKPGLRVKYPWRLSVGDHSWLGEDCWIDNIADVRIGSHVCVSQAAYLCTGNHDWSDRSFSLRLGEIVLEDGAWVGARALVGPGVTVGRLAVLTAGGVANRAIPACEVHGGNPAAFVRMRPVGTGCIRDAEDHQRLSRKGAES